MLSSSSADNVTTGIAWMSLWMMEMCVEPLGVSTWAKGGSSYILLELPKALFTPGCLALDPGNPTQNSVAFTPWVQQVLKYHVVAEHKAKAQPCTQNLVWILGKRCVHISAPRKSYSGAMLAKLCIKCEHSSKAQNKPTHKQQKWK